MTSTLKDKFDAYLDGKGIEDVPGDSQLDKRVRMACDKTPLKVFYGSYIREDGLYDLYLVAEKSAPKPKTDKELLEAAIDMLDEDRSLGREEILIRLERR